MESLKPQVQKRRKIAITLLIIGVNLAVFGLTDPFSSPILVILFGFLVCFADLLLLTHYCLRFFEQLLPAIKPLRRRLLVSLGGFELLILALASLGQLTWWSVTVVTIIWLVGYFYSLYLRFPLTANR